MNQPNRTNRNNHKFYDVPAGTKPTECKRCGMAVYWVTANNRHLLIDCSVVGGNEPSESRDVAQTGLFGVSVHDGSGISHFIDCPPDGAR